MKYRLDEGVSLYNKVSILVNNDALTKTSLYTPVSAL